jgi:DNA-binding MarR family transcriptional regulator
MNQESSSYDQAKMPETCLPAEDIWSTASATRRSVTRMARCLRRLRSPHGVSGSKLSLLGCLFRAARPMTATDLARTERLQPQSLTRLIADLEEGGFIHRRQDDVDRRQVLIEIAPKGRELLIQDAQQQDTWLARVMTTRLTRAERQVLRIASELLDQLADEDPDTAGDVTTHSSHG